MVKTDQFTLQSIFDALPPDVNNRNGVAEKILENLVEINAGMSILAGREADE